jgi:selenocysteine lyase/cysteine desulfurase
LTARPAAGRIGVHLNMSLYLDTARLGQMCPESQRADRDFARLAGEEAGSLYYDFLLRAGFLSLPPTLRRLYSGLRGWSGVRSLKKHVQLALGFSSKRQLYLASRTAQLVRLASRVLCRQCENILVTDMLWPAYRRILEEESRRCGRVVTTVPLRAAIFDERMTLSDLVGRLADAYGRENCDGLFLSAVTYHGIRMPVAEISQAASQVRRPGFVVIDAAQAVNHVPLHATARHSDFMIAGCHKWLRAYHPMGFGFCCRSSAEELMADSFSEMLQSGDVDDPLLRFSWELETGACEPFSETVNLAPLFTVTAAVERIWHSRLGRHEKHASQLANTDQVADLAKHTPWRPVRPTGPMRSGILLLRAKRSETRSASPEAVRFAFRRRGVTLSAYDGGLVRASIPPLSLPARGLDRLRAALNRCA